MGNSSYESMMNSARAQRDAAEARAEQAEARVTRLEAVLNGNVQPPATEPPDCPHCGADCDLLPRKRP